MVRVQKNALQRTNLVDMFVLSTGSKGKYAAARVHPTSTGLFAKHAPPICAFEKLDHQACCLFTQMDPDLVESLPTEQLP